MPKILLITLGHSPMIIPEAILGYGVDFDEVHILTTNNENLTENIEKIRTIGIELLQGKRLTLSVTRDISIVHSKETFGDFEEILYQWFVQTSGNEQPYVCLSGGTKTIPASTLQAARYFGAKDVFHVIIDAPQSGNPSTLEEVKSAMRNGRLKILNLGPEAGWPGIKEMALAQEYPAVIPDQNFPDLKWIETPKQRPLSSKLQFITNEVRNASVKEYPGELPFSMLQLLPPETRQWLNEALNTDTDANWVKSLPKTDLHCHLGGFATHGELLRKVREGAENPGTLESVSEPPLPEGWPFPERTVSLNSYMHLGDANGSKLLKDPGSLKTQVDLLYDHFTEQNLRYAEVRCSPDNYTTNSHSAWHVLEDVISHFQHKMTEALEKFPDRYCHVNLLIIATRKKTGDLSSISRHLALAITASQRSIAEDSSCRVVGVDLAGYENAETRPAYFANDFIGVHRSGLAVTAHAGENDDAESIWQAVHQLHARRIGHGLNLWEAKDLVRTMADRRIGVEMCPYANYQIRGFEPMPGSKEKYPLKEYLDKGILVSVNTDNIGISAASITDNFLLLAKLVPGVTRLETLRLIRNGLETAFIPNAARRELYKILNRQIFQCCLKSSLSMQF